MHEIGTIALKIGFYTSIIAFLALIFPKQSARVKSTPPGILMGLIACLSILLSTTFLLTSLVYGDFSIQFVYHNTDQHLPLIYKISALWSGSAGSMLFWTSILAIMLWCMAIKKKEDPVLRTIFGSILVLIIGFMMMITYMHNPFELVTSQTDGFGLNPALQSLGMVVHPPILIIGFCCFFIAFGYAVYDLMHQEQNHIGSIRKWSVWGYALLTIGIITGGLWAYTELGWGGYWSWDPVENMSLVNWTLATALLHVIHQKQKRTIHTFLLTTATAFSILFGTFITRSGILKSVHAYSGGKLAMMLGGFILVVLLGICAILICYRIKYRHSTIIDTDKLDRKAFIAPMNLGILLVIIMACTVFAGTIYPLVSRIIGQEVHETPIAYYEYTFGLMGLGLICLIGSSKRLFPKGSMFSLIGGGIGTILFVILSITNKVELLPKLAISLAMMVLVNMVLHYAQDYTSYKKIKGYFSLWFIHASFIVLAIGIIFSKNMVQGGERKIGLTETVRIGDYQVNYADIQEREGIGKTIATAILNIQDGKSVTTIRPELSYYHKRGIVHGRAVIKRRLHEDLHIIFRGLEEDNTIILEMKSIGLMSCVWLGSFMLAIGMVLRLFHMRERRVMDSNQQATMRNLTCQKEVG